MSSLLQLEFMKLRRTFLVLLLPLALFVPLALVLIQYGFHPQQSFTAVITKNSVFMQMISFASVVITGCYIVAREYRQQLISYLAITPKSLTRILLSKYILLFLEIAVLQGLTFGLLIVIHSLVSGFDPQLAADYMTAGVLSTLCLMALTPAVVYVALWKRNASAAALLFLVVFMLTYPFAFKDFGAFLPHLLPIILVSKFLGYEQYAHISYARGGLILLAVFMGFLILSIHKINSKE